MISIDAGAGHGPVIGLPEPQRKADGTSHVVKSPPAAAEVPSKAVAPPQQGEGMDGPRARAEVEDLAERLNREFAQRPDRLNRRIRFSVDPRTEELIVRVIDGNTERVLGQFPPDYVLRRMEAFEALKGILVHDEV